MVACVPALFGHTLGTSHLDLDKALELFASVGLDGAEVIWQDGYRSGLAEGDLEQARRIRRQARDLGLSIGCLTPYISGINSLDDAERERDVGRFLECLRTAELLQCPLVRVYAGEALESDRFGANVRWRWLVDSLARLADVASESGVVLAVENHFNTMTVSARDTARLVNEVASGAVGALYDQANLAFTHCEPFEEAIEVQKGLIRHVHIKDLIFVDETKTFVAGSDVSRVDVAERAVRSRVIGDGTLDWPAIIRRLNEVGYKGPYSFEYEYRWHPQDLPDPEEGFATSVIRMRRILESVIAT